MKPTQLLGCEVLSLPLVGVLVRLLLHTLPLRHICHVALRGSRTRTQAKAKL